MTAKPGAEAEALAEAFLKNQGLSLLARNFNVRGGELDLIMDHQGTTVFVEVRLRTNKAFANALESITASKQQKLQLAAQHYLAQTPQRQQTPCRFDVIAFNNLNQPPQWLQAAFS
ncbi:YraN family protein [Simiduia sp. 21SJ11W-1]|uniref:YraN family protein n=1 Tax=Simiduia sp. 21SJ11W-1 TaxID=2909669 RepID=UPI0020A13D4E|nr:YraN family protein [Simiduia sp. 21SJ11W-1]UTA48855.1 YraN family protein [Simiduia sp. 21SJ11W-1]